MIDCEIFYNSLSKRNITFFCGVPDSLLSDFSAFLHDNVKRHVITANEGNAIALAAGSFLATGNPGFVYLQNSGQGNTVNPLVSLAHPSVYGIPMLMMVGWRGEPGRKDEPQHMNQGAITEAIFSAMGIPCLILPEEPDRLDSFLDTCCSIAVEKETPVAILVRSGTFSHYKIKVDDPFFMEMTREEAIREVISKTSNDSAIISTTGKISRELYSLRHDLCQPDHGDFLTVGSMGHASQIAMGIALEQMHRTVYCFDGDGAAIMHMGAMAIIGSSGLKNFIHVVFNNAAHDSVGGQPTVGAKISLTEIAHGCGYGRVSLVRKPSELDAALRKSEAGPVFVEIRVAKGSREDLARPASSPSERKRDFISFLRRNEK